MIDDRRRCAVCGIPLRPSQSGEETCASAACRRLHQIRRPAAPLRRCLYCSRAAVPPAATCDAPQCRKLEADHAEARRKAAARRIEVAEKIRDREGALRAEGERVLPDPILRAQLPVNEHTIVPISEDRRAFLATRLSSALDRALEDPDRPLPESPETPARHDALVSAACAACRGSCCKSGGDHAFLTPDHFRRLLRLQPSLSRETILARYLSHLPAAGFHDSCIYHSSDGCSLPREWRSNLCNTFLCDGLAVAIDAQPKEGAPLPVLAFCFRDQSAELVRTTLIQATGKSTELPSA